MTIRDAISQPSAAAIYATELQRFHWYRVLPLFMVPIHWISRLFTGPAFPPEWALRLPSAVFCAATMPLFYGLGHVVGGRRLARTTMALAVLSPFHLYFAREAYAYGYLMAFSAGVLWASLLLLAHDWSAGIPWKAMSGFVASATLMLQTHLTGLVFLSVWLVVMGCMFFRKLGPYGTFRPRVLVPLLICVLVPYVVFFPFLARILAAGYTSTDSSLAVAFSFSALRAIAGRMGWGEAPWAIVPFLAACVAGAISCLKANAPPARAGGAALLAQLGAYIAFQATYQCLTHSRFEVRYFSAAFPIVTVFSAAGLASLWGARADAARIRPRHAWIARFAAPCVTALVAAWLLLGDGLVVAMGCRGYDYKGIARWINHHVPDGGVYAFYNVYELRAVPTVYPTPGRVATSVGVWSSQDEFDRVNPPERTRSMFQRFPETYFVEIVPADLLDPTSKWPPIARDELFMRREWIEDAATEWLFALGLHPLGEVQRVNRSIHKTLLSFNLPDDLPELARRQGRSVYHAFGSGWQYVNDQACNHWMLTTGPAQVIAGNATDQTLDADLVFTILPQPPGCRVQVLSPTGALVANFELPADPEHSGLVTHRVPRQALQPGTTRYRLGLEPLLSGSMRPVVALYSFEVQPSAPATRGGVAPDTRSSPDSPGVLTDGGTTEP